MHSRMIELARTETCWRESEGDDLTNGLRPAIGIVCGLALSIPMWAVIAIVAWAALT